MTMALLHSAISPDRCMMTSLGKFDFQSHYSSDLCSHKNKTLKILHSQSEELSIYVRVKFLSFVKSRLIFNIFYCF